MSDAMITDAELDEIEAVLNAATTGDWRNERFATDPEHPNVPSTNEEVLAMQARMIAKGSGFHYSVSPKANLNAVVAYTGNGPTSEANARFIVVAKTAMPSLLAAYRAARARIRELEAEQQQLRLDRSAFLRIARENEATIKAVKAWAASDANGEQGYQRAQDDALIALTGAEALQGEILCQKCGNPIPPERVASAMSRGFREARYCSTRCSGAAATVRYRAKLRALSSTPPEATEPSTESALIAVEIYRRLRAGEKP